MQNGHYNFYFLILKLSYAMTFACVFGFSTHSIHLLEDLNYNSTPNLQYVHHPHFKIGGRHQCIQHVRVFCPFFKDKTRNCVNLWKVDKCAH